MDILIRYGFTIEEIKIMMDTNSLIENINDNNIKSIISILEKVNCNLDDIKNILICNPFCITNNINDINNLIDKLKDIGIIELNKLFRTNPYILNISDKELDKLYNEKKEVGLNKEEIIDYINYNIIFWGD